MGELRSTEDRLSLGSDISQNKPIHRHLSPSIIFFALYSYVSSSIETRIVSTTTTTIIIQARDDLRSQFELYVPKKIEDPYSLDFLKKKRGPAAVATIPEKDLRTAVTALGWHTLSDAEVGECGVWRGGLSTCSAAAAVIIESGFFCCIAYISKVLLPSASNFL